VRIPWLTREYERTCDDCGYVWRVPEGIAHPHMQGLPMTRGGRGVGSGAVAARADAVAEANAELAERAQLSGAVPSANQTITSRDRSGPDPPNCHQQPTIGHWVSFHLPPTRDIRGMILLGESGQSANNAGSGGAGP
jgi:hypothetical protein